MTLPRCVHVTFVPSQRNEPFNQISQPSWYRCRSRCCRSRRVPTPQMLSSHSPRLSSLDSHQALSASASSPRPHHGPWGSGCASPYVQRVRCRFRPCPHSDQTGCQRSAHVLGSCEVDADDDLWRNGRAIRCRQGACQDEGREVCRARVPLQRPQQRLVLPLGHVATYWDSTGPWTCWRLRMQTTLDRTGRRCRTTPLLPPRFPPSQTRSHHETGLRWHQRTASLLDPPQP